MKIFHGLIRRREQNSISMRLLKREEMGQAGVYVLTGANPEPGKPMACVVRMTIGRMDLRHRRTRGL
jgi:hypothetical protein